MVREVTYLLNLLVLSGRIQDCRDIVGKAQLLERLGNVITGNRLFGLLLRDLVCLGRDEGDEFDTAIYENISRFLGESHTTRGWQDLADDLLDRS